jgi:NADH:ubiquinone oxidoreductase subunit 2 (subunit N)
MREPGDAAAGESAEASAPAGAALQFAVYASAAGTLLLGIFPGWVLDAANRAALK